MNDYDDSEDYSSYSFRARSNTWPLNRPDLAVPNSVCIDETLPEIELEDDDLFTTNENWSTGLVDHDIMSWDPILNAQSHTNQQSHHHHHPQHQQQQTTGQQVANNPQQQHHHYHHLQQQQPQVTTIHHHHQPHPQQQQQPVHHQQPNNNNNESILCGSTIIVNRNQQHQPQLPQQLPSTIQPQQTTQQPTTAHDADDANEYHIHQMHHLCLDNNPPPPPPAPTTSSSASSATSATSSQPQHQPPQPNNNDHHQQQVQHYLPPVCFQSSATNSGAPIGAPDNYNISPDHHHQQHHHLQPLASARYDLDQHHHLNDLEPLNDATDNLHHQQQHHNQLHHLTSTSLTDHHSHMLSSSLSTSGIGLSDDFEDLDHKGGVGGVVDQSSSILMSDSIAQFKNDHLDQQDHEQQQQQLLQQGLAGSESGGSGSNKQSNSATSSKTKLNTPRRNAWGNLSYADLISQAINSTNDKRLTLSQIYDWMVQNIPYFKDKGDSNSSAGWKNSVRHNLSLHNRFKRLQNEGTGKSSWWTINPEANIGKCARRRAASMEASKYEKKRGRAKKRADAVRQGLISYPSLTNSSLNGSIGNLEPIQPLHHQSASQFIGPRQTTTDGIKVEQQQPQPQTQQQPIIQQQQQQPVQQQQQPILQQQHHTIQQQQPHTIHQQQPQPHQQQQTLQTRQQPAGLYISTTQEPQYEHDCHHRYHHFELSTAL